MEASATHGLIPGVGLISGVGLYLGGTVFTQRQSGSWTQSCDSLRDRGVVWILYGAASTKVPWSSFGQVLLPRNALESACEALSEKRVNPVQPSGHCSATVSELSSCRQGETTYWILSTNGKLLPF